MRTISVTCRDGVIAPILLTSQKTIFRLIIIDVKTITHSNTRLLTHLHCPPKVASHFHTILQKIELKYIKYILKRNQKGLQRCSKPKFAFNLLKTKYLTFLRKGVLFYPHVIAFKCEMLGFKKINCKFRPGTMLNLLLFTF